MSLRDYQGGSGLPGGGVSSEALSVSADRSVVVGLSNQILGRRPLYGPLLPECLGWALDRLVPPLGFQRTARLCGSERSWRIHLDT